MPAQVIGPESGEALRTAFLDYTAQVFPGVDFRRWHRLGGWTADYRVHVQVEAGEVLAAVASMRMRLRIEGCDVEAHQLGAVGCLPAHRGRGLVRPLMEAALAAAPEALVFLYANETVLGFYPRFGFRPHPESVFEWEAEVAPSGPPAPRLDLDDPEQRGAWLAACDRSLAPSERLGTVRHGAIALWHACNFHRDRIRVLAGVGAYVVAVQRGEVLEVLDVAAPRPFDLERELGRLVTTPVRRVRLGFCPDRWLPQARAVGVDPEAGLFVKGTLALPGGPLRFPALAQT